MIRFGFVKVVAIPTKFRLSLTAESEQIPLASGQDQIERRLFLTNDQARGIGSLRILHGRSSLRQRPGLAGSRIHRS
jgi:hypothetical protein